MYYKTAEDVDDGSGILLHHAESTLYLGPTQILKQNFGYTSTHRLVLFLMSKVSVITTFMESRFRSPHSSSSSSGNAGPYYFAYVMIITQPSSHASPGGYGGTENKQFFRNWKNKAWKQFFGTIGTVVTGLGAQRCKPKTGGTASSIIKTL